MTNFPTSPIADRPGGLLLQRAVGLAALVAGLALLGLGLFAFTKGANLPTGVDATIIAITVATLAVATLFLSCGWRMTFNVPNKYASVFSPWIWYFLALTFFLATFAIAYQMLAQAARFDIGALFGTLALSFVAAAAGRNAQNKATRQ